MHKSSFWLLGGVLVFILCCFPLKTEAQLDQLMPMPKQVISQKGAFRLDSSFTVFLRRIQHSRIEGGLQRFLTRLDNQTGLLISKIPTDIRFPGDGFNVMVERKGRLELHEDESYSLEVGKNRIMLKAETDLGALHGLETLLQTLSADTGGYYFPAVLIEDEPRFPWRGLLMDVCRHFMPTDVVKRNLEGMAAMKMNVFHWHLSEDQGFRVESKLFPRLQEMGSNGQFYTQVEIKEIIAFADARGIRVVPEFDIPGHSSSWFLGQPELASGPGPYKIEKRFGVIDGVMNPAKETTYKFLEAFLGEMCVLFPDAYFHIGGDEVNPKLWKNNLEIQAFMKEKKIRNTHDLQLYFNQRVLEMLVENGKRMMGWDEIMNPDLPKNAVIQSWRGKEALVKSAKEGYDVLLSNGYYIDLCRPAGKHYLNDPLPKGVDLDGKQMQHVLGGEATMWAELVSPETVDSRIWPRTCAIAERFWSPRFVNDVADMYRRLKLASLRLEERGLLHLRNPDMMMRRLCQGADITSLQVLMQVVEPLKGYKRHGKNGGYTTDRTLTRLPDIAVPDAVVARQFNQLAKDYKASPDQLKKIVLKGWFSIWIRNHDKLMRLSYKVPAVKGAVPLSASLKALAKIGNEVLDLIERKEPLLSKRAAYLEVIEKAAESSMECELMIIEGMKSLVD